MFFSKRHTVTVPSIMLSMVNYIGPKITNMLYLKLEYSKVITVPYQAKWDNYIHFSRANILCIIFSHKSMIRRAIYSKSKVRLTYDLYCMLCVTIDKISLLHVGWTVLIKLQDY